VRHDVGGAERQSVVRQEGVLEVHPWATAHLPDTVQSTSSQRGGQATEARSSPVRSTAPELNEGEGGGPTARGAALSSSKPPGPAHEDRKRVRWLTRRGQERWCRREAMGWPPFIVVPCVGATRPAQGERKGGDGWARR
jgi:hypothetical protein